MGCGRGVGGGAQETRRHSAQLPEREAQLPRVDAGPGGGNGREAVQPRGAIRQDTDLALLRPGEILLM